MLGKIKRIDGGFVIDFEDLIVSVSKLQLDTFYLCNGDVVDLTDPTIGYLTLNINNELKSVKKIDQTTSSRSI